MRNSTTNRRQTWLTRYRVCTTLMLIAILAIGVSLLTRPASTSAPTVTEIAEAVNGPEKFQRPSNMEYVVKTNSCIVGGTVTATEWHVGAETFGVEGVDPKSVDYTSFGFMSDTGQVFSVSHGGALWTSPGENLGLQLHCDPATMTTDPSFGMISIIYGGK